VRIPSEGAAVRMRRGEDLRNVMLGGVTATFTRINIRNIIINRELSYITDIVLLISNISPERNRDK